MAPDENTKSTTYIEPEKSMMQNYSNVHAQTLLMTCRAGIRCTQEFIRIREQRAAKSSPPEIADFEGPKATGVFIAVSGSICSATPPERFDLLLSAENAERRGASESPSPAARSKDTIEY